MNDLMTQSWAAAQADVEAGVTPSVTNGDGGRARSLWPSQWQGKGVRVECDGSGGSGSAGTGTFTVFSTEAESISSDIAAMSVAAWIAKATQERAASAPSLAAAAALRERLSADLASVRQQAVSVKGRIAKLQAEIEARLKGGQVVHGKDRHRREVTQSLCRKLKEVMASLAALGAATAATHRAEVERQVQIVTGEKPSAAELDRLMGAGSDAVLQAAVAGQGREGVAGLLADLGARQDAMHKLRREVAELQAMFVDMAAMVEAQGEVINEVEVGVEAAVEEVKGGVEHLVKAREWQLSTRKWQLTVAGIILLVVIAIVIYIKLKYFS